VDPILLVVFQSMSEPEQPEPKVAEAGPGNAGNACFKCQINARSLAEPKYGYTWSECYRINTCDQNVTVYLGKLQESTNGVYATTLSKSFKQGQHG